MLFFFAPFHLFFTLFYEPECLVLCSSTHILTYAPPLIFFICLLSSTFIGTFVYQMVFFFMFVHLLHPTSICKSIEALNSLSLSLSACVVLINWHVCLPYSMFIQTSLESLPVRIYLHILRNVPLSSSAHIFQLTCHLVFMFVCTHASNHASVCSITHAFAHPSAHMSVRLCVRPLTCLPVFTSIYRRLRTRLRVRLPACTSTLPTSSAHLWARRLLLRLPVPRASE